MQTAGLIVVCLGGEQPKNPWTVRQEKTYSAVRRVTKKKHVQFNKVADLSPPHFRKPGFAGLMKRAKSTFLMEGSVSFLVLRGVKDAFPMGKWRYSSHRYVSLRWLVPGPEGFLPSKPLFLLVQEIVS